ncbi:mechanosensitive ion channel family protein [Calderihabitans maritimus]|uniref:Mechanosensitive ion channel protein MscS n=1 Tax=Calderihabitans maritimus TaxID=1246530 RepID=A0A1Z5HVZ2_9FIRM|nr:mechanosensitive ion channel family protein [Calderihabitans maritimus]GAW93706.1 hypothetical protein KKC1_28340 [Calderihabitans maritimus]
MSLTDIWVELRSLFGWYLNPTFLRHLIWKLAEIILVILLAKGAIIVGNKIINRIFSLQAGLIVMEKKLASTLEVLIKSLVTYGIYFLAAIAILEIIEIRIINTEDIKQFGGAILKAVGILIVSRVVLRFGGVVIDHIFQRPQNKEFFLEERRAQTLAKLLKSVLSYLIYFVAGVMVMETFGVRTSSVLATAGIAGLAVGFGAQNLVRDIITGFFIIFEDQFAVGEYVSTAGVTGVVEEMGLRTTKIREWTGQLHIIPNGEITRVTNYNRGKMLALITVSIAYEEDIDQAIEVLRQACEKAYQEVPGIAEVPIVQGVIELGASEVVIRVIAATVPGEQWSVERELRKRLKQALDQAGIEIPYPRRVIIQQTQDENKAGESKAAREGSL